MISFNEALGFVQSVYPMADEIIPAEKALFRVLSQPVLSKTSAPAVTSSLKDGYAVISADIRDAARANPVGLIVKGTVTAGEEADIKLKPGEALKIMTGAPVPPGATAVIPQELTPTDGKNHISALASSEPGRNILDKGADIKEGETILEKNTFITPAISGLVSASGNDHVRVYRRPAVSVLATGSEIADEGSGCHHGKIFPSNRATIAAWLRKFGIECRTALCGDDAGQIKRQLEELLEISDVVITSGGVLDGERDLVISVMERVGVKFLFKRCRIGPGKGVCMGRKADKFVFNLPGGPPSNYVAFLFIALPAIIRRMGITKYFPPAARATVTAEIKGRSDWTQLILANAVWRGPSLSASPVPETSRLKRIAFSNCIIVLPEGASRTGPGETAEIRLLFPCQP